MRTMRPMNFLGELALQVVGDVIGEGVRDGVGRIRRRTSRARRRRKDGRHPAPEVVLHLLEGEVGGLRPSRRGAVGTLDELGRFVRQDAPVGPVQLRLLDKTPRELRADERWAPREMVVFSVASMSGVRAELGVFRDETYVAARLVDG
jgi:hypothetical protein